MADVGVLESRREIRRRKILENSESRIKKITGRDACTISDEKPLTPEKIPESSCSYAKISYENAQRTPVISSNEETCSEQREKLFISANGDDHIHRIIKNERKQCHGNYFRQDTAHETSNCSDVEETLLKNGTTRPGSSEAYAFPKKVSDAETRSYGRSRLDSRRNSSCTQIMMESLQLSSFKCSGLRPWVFVIAAILIKIVLLFDGSFLVTQNLFLPFALLEIFVNIWMKLEAQVYPRSLPQSVIPGLLILCGIPGSVALTFSELYNGLYYIGQDFAIYLFSFVFLHFLCKSCC